MDACVVPSQKRSLSPSVPIWYYFAKLKAPIGKMRMGRPLASSSFPTAAYGAASLWLNDQGRPLARVP